MMWRTNFSRGATGLTLRPVLINSHKTSWLLRRTSSTDAPTVSPSSGNHMHGASGQLGRREKPIPSAAQVVVCGGGVIGSSIAYHLPKCGFNDVILLEQGSLSCGTTWHAAGLLTASRGSRAHTKINTYSNELYARLEEETGLGTGVKWSGTLGLASTKDRLIALRRQQAVARSCGVYCDIISAQQAKEICPILRTDDIVGALYVPDEISAGNPSDICQSLAKGASLQGVGIYEGVCVESVDVEGGRVTGVRTNKGHINCEVFVNCAGQWARQLGELSAPSVNIPLHSTEHFYIVTKPFDGVDVNMPTVRDPDRHMYVREWSGGILAGCFEVNGRPCFQDGVPQSFEYQLLPEDWDHIQPLTDAILHRIPAVEKAEIRQMINGPESFTTDGHAILGEAPGTRNYFVAAGMNSGGIASAGGFGRALAEWIADGEPPCDLWEFDITRFSPHTANKNLLRDGAQEMLGRHYSLPWPRWELELGRGVKQTPLHSRLESEGASFGCVYGWERPNWFAKGGESRVNELTYDRPNWFDRVKEEHLACRGNVALFDLSAFAKLEIEGPETESAMQQLCANNMAVQPGQVVYTGMLNSRGGFQTDCTVTRLSLNKYLAICPSAQPLHVSSWIERHLPSSVSLQDVTSQYSVLALMGPHSRQLLQSLTKTPLDNKSFPFATAQIIQLGYASGIRAIRISYMGELGWELHVPTEYSLHVFDQLMAAGQDYGMKLAGAYSVDTLRLEKGYRHWGHELDTETTPLEAGLDFAVDMNKEFIGKETLIKQKEAGLTQLLGLFTIDLQDDTTTLPWGNESIYRNGEYAGYVTSAGFGHTLGKAVCMGYVCAPGKSGVAGGGKSTTVVTRQYLKEGSYEIEINGKLWPASLRMTPPYDPKSKQVRS